MLNRVYWGCWIVGAILIMLSRMGYVPTELGWAGFCIATAAAVLSRFPRRAQATPAEEWAHLTNAMLESKDHGYVRAMQCVHAGGSVVCDGGLIFRVCSDDEIQVTSSASRPIAEMDDSLAIHDAERAASAFEAVSCLSPEIAEMAMGRNLRVSLVSELSPNGIEICQVVDRQVEWSPAGR